MKVCAVPASPTGQEHATLMRVSQDDPVYGQQLRGEEDFWARPIVTLAELDASLPLPLQRLINEAYTGDPATTWMQDLIARGPFDSAAMLGCSEGALEAEWLKAGGSRRLDIYEVGRTVIAKARARLKVRRFGLAWPDSRVRFVHSDLNFVHLPRDHYDVIWSSGCVHHLVNLEYLFAEVEAALRPGGLFALQDYVGEKGLQYSRERLDAINAVLDRIPPKYRRGGIEAITPPPPHETSPFEAIRSDEVLGLASARFATIRLGLTGRLFPLGSYLDLAAMEREAPGLLGEFLRAEQQAGECARPLKPCAAYAVFQKRT